MPSLIRRRKSVVTSKKTGKPVERIRWHVQIPISRVNGKTEYLRKTFDTQGEAKAFVADRLEERKTGGVVKPSEKTVEKYLEEWLEATASSRRENTQAAYRELIDRYLVPRLGERRLCDLTPLAIQRVYGELLDAKLSARTVRYVHSVLHNALDSAVQWRMLSVNPTAAVKLPKRKPTRTMRPLNEEEAKRFLTVCRARDEKGKLAHRLGVYFEVALVTGMRPSELFALHWRDVNLKAGAVTVRRSLVRTGGGKWKLAETKTERGRRSIPIPLETVEALKEWKRRQAEERIAAGSAWTGASKPTEGLVFTGLQGQPLETRNLSLRDLARVAIDAGLAEELEPKPRRGKRGPKPKPRYRSLITLYDLRHTCATLMLAAGVNPKVASERLGHASVAFTLDVYSHVLPGMQESATKKLGGLLYG